ncbi:glycosyl transferase [Synergistales bacterium]|nr:glycosyl transferase [Synergistales bacterium]
MGDKKLIGFILPSLGSGGGVERVVVNLANQFAEKGYPVDIVLWSGNVDSPYSAEIDKSVNVISIRGPQRQYNLLFKGIAALCSIGKMVRYINRARPGVIFASTCELIAIMANELAKNRSKMAVIVHSDPSFSSVLIMQRGKILRLRFFRWLSKLLYPKADWVTGVSKGVAEGVARNGIVPENKIGFIYNPVVTRSLKEKSKEIPGHPWLAKKDCPVFIGVGRLSVEKNFALLLRAFKLVSDKLDSVLLIIGEGALLDDLKKLSAELGIESRVDFTGFLKNPFGAIAHADVFVLSSNVEGLPSVMIEAMACGCQIVSTNCPSGPAEILEGGKFGRLVPVDDETALSEAMLLAYSDPIDKNFLLEHAETFNAGAIGQQYITLAEGLMDGK